MAERMDLSGRSMRMLMQAKERRSAMPTLRGWAVDTLHEAGAIRECEEHGWMRERADPHARERGLRYRPRCEGQAMLQQADRLLCESWNERMWSYSEPIDPTDGRYRH
jgi:hypothetical protein